MNFSMNTRMCPWASAGALMMAAGIFTGSAMGGVGDGGCVEPELIGSMLVGEDNRIFVNDIVIVGSKAYLSASPQNGATSDARLIIADVSDPSSPTVIEEFPIVDRAFDIAIEGSLVYIADGSGFVVVDVSGAATLVGMYESTGFVRDISVSGSIAYITDSLDGLVVLDVSDPSAPIVLGTYIESGLHLHNLEVVGTKAYVTNGRMRIIDVSDPSSPTLEGFTPPAVNASHMIIDGTIGYMASGAILRVMDLSDTNAPQLIGEFTAQNLDIRDIAIDGSTLYLAGGNLYGVALDVSDPSSPVFLSSFRQVSNAVAVGLGGELFVGGQQDLNAYDTSGIGGCALPCIADLNGDGALNFFDISAFLNAFAQRSFSVDFNNDSQHNIFDISSFLVAFGNGCP